MLFVKCLIVDTKNQSIFYTIKNILRKECSSCEHCVLTLIEFQLVFVFYVFRRGSHPALFLKVKNAPCLLSKSKLRPALFLEVKNAPCLFSEVKNAPCLFSEMKNKPCPFSTICRMRKLVSCRKSKNATWKVCVRKNSCTQKQQILRQNVILFLHGETFNKNDE